MFSFKKKINFYDCDPAGILFYGRTFELCHSAYEAMIESFKLDEDYWNNENYIVPIIHSEASYHKPVKYGDEIVIEITVNQIKNSSFQLEYVLKNSDGEKCTAVKTAHVFVNKSNWKKTSIIEPVVNGLMKYQKRD